MIFIVPGNAINHKINHKIDNLLLLHDLPGNYTTNTWKN
jgi:hypothetical protein